VHWLSCLHNVHQTHAGLFPQAHRLEGVSEEDSGPLAAPPTQELYLTDGSLPGRLEPRKRSATVRQDERPAHVYVMRHGERQDMVDPSWGASTSRPWDPPLSQFGMQQATQRGQEFASARRRVDVVVCSPFTRCIQTACGFMCSYGLPSDCLLVDARVCEWMSSRNLNLQHVARASQPALHGPAKGWFWAGPALKGIHDAVCAAWSAAAAAQVRNTFATRHGHKNCRLILHTCTGDGLCCCSIR
jgi:broad specificity phosphatase PhoE